MKAASLYFALSAAQVAICAPAPGVSTARQNNAPNAVAARRSWTTYLDENEATGRDRHDPIGRPDLLPPAYGGDSEPPLSKHKKPNPGSPRPGRQPPLIDLRRVPHPARDEDDGLELLDVGGAGGSPHSGMPSHHARSSRERNDMLVVLVAVAFMVAVVVMETWGSLFRRQGVIRNEETANQAPVSIRAMPEDQIGIGDEKRHV
ncbi:hypothetical protein N657DRAFT_339423 [Parathielavia appendiculata]|uniref:Uncharacterized protein n=1 Tax=Parathielavia appendiculata TaxID=2587402 RepID=A0AAN6U1Y5_9PEZI|nr:hypothetical protein N657DRAFT_339423 [Parathielavia appendiculata]